MTYQHNNKDPNLNNLHHAMEYRDGMPHLRVNIGSDTVTINGNINVDNVTVDNLATDPVPISSNKTQNSSNNPLYVNIGTTGTVSLSASSLSALETTTVNQGTGGTSAWKVDIGTNGTVTANVSGTVGVSNFPATQAVTGTFWQATQPVSIASLPEIEIKNDTGNPVPVTGNVTATIGNIITVVTTEDAGAKYSFNNHAANATRGWTMDNTMRPVVSFQNGSDNVLDIIKILEYEIGNNNANQSTIVYEWYEGPLTIAGAAIPSWTTFGQHSQYRVYQDQYSSNQGNTFTVPSGTYMRHSGIIIGKNTSGDEGPASLYGGSSRNMLTLCMRRVDNATKLDVWFAFTIRELT